MELRGKVLLIYRDDRVFDGLSRVLESLGLEANCEELACSLQDGGTFLTVFTEATPPHGGYRDVCRIASQTPKPLPVIVVSPFVDLDLYLESMEKGASDFIVPPFLCTDIAHVLMTAISDPLPRRLAPFQHAARRA